ncbi:MAG TPA: type I methionyl aminopeptidase [Bacteroidia bacterium]|nr:type I methionyl aminopeptidase [Bacteroidia bacterium]
MGTTIYYKTESDIEKIRESSLIVSKTLAEVGKAIKPGITTGELDKIAESYILSQGARPAFKGYKGFPATLCVSVNAQVVHGIPGNYALKEGDIVSVDCGVVKDSYYGDSAYTFRVGKISEEVANLLKVTKESLYKGIEAAVEGNRMGDLSAAIGEHAEEHKYGVVRELVGHGIGRNLHEAPDVPNYGKKGNGIRLQAGLVIAIEPMINMGKKEVKQENDGWTITTKDGKPSAHFEHTVAIRNGKAEILTTFENIEKIEAAQF